MIYVCKCRIQSALSRLIKDKTVMVIAHRMRTVAGADKIVVLSDGKVAETGTPDELMKMSPTVPQKPQGLFSQPRLSQPVELMLYAQD